jgi:hypothetical protein
LSFFILVSRQPKRSGDATKATFTSLKVAKVAFATPHPTRYAELTLGLGLTTDRDAGGGVLYLTGQQLIVIAD